MDDSAPITVGLLAALLEKQTTNLNENMKKTEENIIKHTETQLKVVT